MTNNVSASLKSKKISDLVVDEIYIFTCHMCGCFQFVIPKDESRRPFCLSCDEPLISESHPENKQTSIFTQKPQDEISRRLMMLGELFPWSIRLAVDEEGYTYLQRTLDGCNGRIVVTDGGGGEVEVTGLHLPTVIDHLGYAEVVVWTTEPTDIDLIQAACIPDETTC